MRIAFLLTLLMACTELGEFATDADSVYRGGVVGTDDPDCTPGTACAFIRRGFAVDTELELDFDPAMLDTPGTLTTINEPCGPTLDGATLQSIAPLEHDQLADFDFPGEARLRNYMYVVTPTAGPLAGRDAMAFVSLIRGGGIEVRFIAGSGARQCDPNDCAAIAAGTCDFFGVFRTRRRSR